MNTILKENERLDYLPVRHLPIIQSEEVFVFSLDAVLLAQFTSLPVRKGRVLDLGTGNGAIPLLLSMRTQARIEGVEIQERLVDMAQRSVRINHLTEQIQIRHVDVRAAPATFGHGVFDVLTCNPPYLASHQGEQKHNTHVALARHEMRGTLADFLRVAGELVKTRGKVAFVHRPARLLDLISYMRRYHLEPKRLRFVYPKLNKEANMVLVEAIKDGSPDLRLLPPLIVYTADDEYTEEMKQIYERESMWGIDP